MVTGISLVIFFARLLFFVSKQNERLFFGKLCVGSVTSTTY